MNAIDNLFFHKYIPKGSERIFVLLHGTGGNENDLIPLTELVAPTASILSLRGNVQENGMNRFFERFGDGSFNLKSIATEAAKLKKFLSHWLKKQNKTYDDLCFLGYSNGANFALSFMLLYPNLVNSALLLHPMLPFKPDSRLNFKKTKVLITYGIHDPYSTETQMTMMEVILRKANAVVNTYRHEGGHELQEGEVAAITNFIREPCYY